MRLRLSVAMLGLGAVVLGACGSSVAPAPSPSQGVIEDRAVPTVAMTNQRDQTTSLAALRGKYVVLSPFLSLCQDECPLITGAFLALEQDLHAAGLGNEVVFIEATVDPGRDTQA